MSEWINAKEQLPPKFKIVWIYSKGEYDDSYSITLGRYQDNYWYLLEWDGIPETDVLYWMPLDVPILPKK